MFPRLRRQSTIWMAANGGTQYVIKSSTFSNLPASDPVLSHSVRKNATTVTMMATAGRRIRNPAA